MPGLKTIMQTTPFETTQQKELRASCIETIGCILESVKDQPEVMSADAREVAQYLVELFNSNKLDESDPQVVMIQCTFHQLAMCLKHEFKPYLGPIMECLIRDCKKDVDLRIVDADSAAREDADDKNIKVEINIKGQEGAKQITMNTSALTNKLSAIQIIKSMSDSLGPVFFDWVDPVATLVVNEMMVDLTSSQIRKTATKTLPILMKCLTDSN
jgi:hypothetical protein